MARPMLGDLELEQVQVLETDEDQVVTHHPVPALDGGFVQSIGRRAARLRLTGVLTASPTLESIAELRTKFLAAQPVSFVSDISTATFIDEVLIEDLDVRELAGTPERLEYRFVLREYAEPEPIEPEPIDVPPTPIPEVEQGSLSVTVVVEGDPNFDFERVGVSVEGTPDEGRPMGRRQLTNKIADNVWLEEEFPAGKYRIDAIVDDNQTPTGEHETLTGSAETRVENGEVATVTIVLRRGSKIGTVFVIHFRFDSAFVEPCMRHVMRQVAQFAADHPDEKLLIVGHTDLVGSDAYNQSLSERRGRSAFAFLTSGVDRQRSINEWNELRRTRPVGVLPSSRDTWGSREYQHILQDLGLFKGNVGSDLDLTDAAVRRFQSDHGLNPDGDVGDLTWPVLIEEYLAQDSIGITPDRFLPNADGAGCDEGTLRWLGCSEQDPVLNTQHAWRPNRRTELMFVKETALPCPVPKPDILDLVPDGAGGGGWCLDDGTASAPCCFVTPADQACPPQETKKWCRQPAEPGTFNVSGRLQFSDGSPLGNQKYVLTAPDGEYMDGEVKVTSGAVRAGTPIPGRTDPDGRFSYDRETGTGIYIFEVQGPFVVHREGEPLTEAKGNAVCARLDGRDALIAVVVDRAVASVVPTLAGPAAVVVKKPHTNPARQAINLGVSGPFTGTGTLTRTNDAIRFFDAAAGGNEILFDGTDNVLTSDQLVAGHQVFAEGARASAAVDDVTITLALTVGGTPGLATARQMTSVELTLDIGLSRPSAGVDPPFMSDADKNNPGRPLQLQSASHEAARAFIVVRKPVPADFAGGLTLDGGGGRIAVFTTETPAAGDTATTLPHRLPAASVSPDGNRFFIEGSAVSAAARDAVLQLGLADVEADGDRLAATVIQLEMTPTAAVAAPALTAVRVGLWDDAFDAGTGNLLNSEPAATHFIDRDSRRFHFRVRDPRSAGEIRVGWTTEFDDGTTDDRRPSPPFSDQISLLESAAGSGVFLSRGVMLVTDEDDRDENINSGMAAGHPDNGNRGFGDSNHRVRQITVDGNRELESQTRITYDVLPGVDRFSIRLPVFERTLEDRRRIRVHLIDVRESVGGPPILGLLRELDVTEAIRDIYAVAGIYAEIDKIEIDPPASASSWRATYLGDLLAADPSVEGFTLPGANLVGSTSENDIVAAVRALASFDANDIYIVMVREIYQNPVPVPPAIGLARGSGGEAFPDSFTAAGAATRGFTFVATASGVTEFADPHEATHVTTDLRNAAGGHFDLGAAAAAAAGPIEGKNLMHRFFLATGLGTSNPKRLWDQIFKNTARVPNMVIPAQITAIRGSRFVRPY
jgi:outer membrane protein OmpA-like peptidoglycan-associated protein